MEKAAELFLQTSQQKGGYNKDTIAENEIGFGGFLQSGSKVWRKYRDTC